MNFSNVLNDTYTLVLLGVLLVGYIYLFLYYGLYFLRPARHKEKDSPDTLSSNAKLPPVSVVMVAHNEAEQLKESLPILLEQEYDNYEIIVVDRFSTDDTPFVLKVCSDNYAHIHARPLQNDVNMFQGVKYPISIGIQSAHKDIIILTEPGVIPSGFDWIREMVKCYSKGVDIVIGYSLLQQEKGLCNALQQYENLSFNAVSIGSALMGWPHTATGRSLSFHRYFFFDRGGFISHYSMPQGADQLFVNINATRSNTAVCFSPNASVTARPVPNFRLWLQQQRDKIIPIHRFSWKDKLRRGAYPLAQILFYLSLTLLFVDGVFPWQVLLSLIVIKFGWQIICSSMLAKRLKVRIIQYFSPLFEFYFLILNTFFYLSTLRKK